MDNSPMSWGDLRLKSAHNYWKKINSVLPLSFARDNAECSVLCRQYAGEGSQSPPPCKMCLCVFSPPWDIPKDHGSLQYHRQVVW